MEIDMSAQVSGLRISDFLTTVNGKTEASPKNLIREKKKYMWIIWYFCTAAIGSFCWLEEKYKHQVGCFSFDFIVTEKNVNMLFSVTLHHL